MEDIFPPINFFAILVSGLAYWILGSLWFSLIAGNAWSNELQKHGVTIKEPTKKELSKKLVTTFLLNLLVAFGVAVMIYFIGASGWDEGLILGLLMGICFCAATIGIAYTWENRSFKLFLIDAGYHVLGIASCGIILSIWL